MGKVFAYLRNQWMGALSLFIVLAGGTAWAATELDKNEVKSKHIGKGQVKKQDLADDAVTSEKVQAGTLLGTDFAAGQLPQGSAGEKGEKGEKGEPGQDATNLFANIVDSNVATTAATLGSNEGAVNVSDPDGHNNFTSPYIVTFNRNLTGCVAQATQGRADTSVGSGLIATMSADVSGSTVRLFAQRSDGNNEDTSFMVSVFC